MTDIKEGLNSWRLATNHNRMIELQHGAGEPASRETGLSYYGSSAFLITSPLGITVMIDPWRNLPTGKWDWYFHDFPMTPVDVGVSTHAHFDHDALHRLDANVLIDRPIGTWAFADVRIEGIPDKHAIDASHAIYDMRRINGYFGGQALDPPNNSRNWDNTLIVVETGGLRIAHWGDNRHDAPDEIFASLGRIDILLMPVDDSRHVMGDPMVAEVIERVAPRIVVPHHYYIWNVVQRGSTLLPVENWLAGQPRVRRLDGAETAYAPDDLPVERTVDYFGDHVSFDVDAWHRENGLTLPR